MYARYGLAQECIRKTFLCTLALPSLWHVRGRPGNALDNAGLPRSYIASNQAQPLVDMVTTGSRRHHINKGWAWFEASLPRCTRPDNNSASRLFDQDHAVDDCDSSNKLHLQRDLQWTLAFSTASSRHNLCIPASLGVMLIWETAFD